MWRKSLRFLCIQPALGVTAVGRLLKLSMNVLPEKEKFGGFIVFLFADFSITVCPVSSDPT